MQSILDSIQSTDLYAAAKCRALIRCYDEMWRNKWAGYEILDVEKEFEFPLLNPDSEAPSQTFNEAGKIDLLVRSKATGRELVTEHKTTGDSIAPASDYWDRLRLDFQCSIYNLAAAHLNHDVAGIIYDVIRKPGQYPSKVPTLDPDGFKIVLDSNGQRVMTKDGKKPRETGDTEKGWVVQGRPETPAEYEARLLSVIRAAPNEFFAQRDIARTNDDLLEYMKDKWAFGQQVLYARRNDLWPRNPNACTTMGTCEMFDLCCGRASVDTVNYRKKEKIHAELEMQGNGKELLTNSRANSYRKCARLHKLRYEDGVEKVRPDDDDSPLGFGTLMHKSLELYFNQMKEGVLA